MTKHTQPAAEPIAEPIMSAISPETAEHILQRLGAGGVPPEHGVQAINVGNESYLRVLRTEYFGRLLKVGATFKLVQGYFGAGKTHFLHCVRELAWEHGFAAALVELSPTECPYDDSHKVYMAVAGRIAAPPAQPLAHYPRGLADLVRCEVERRLDLALDADGPTEARATVSRWLQRDVGRAPCESHSYRHAVIGLGQAYLDDDFATQRTLSAWLAGEPVPVKETRPMGVYEAIDKRNGFTMLRCLTQMVRALDLPGVALLFDEVDRNLSVSAKRSHTIGDNLRQVIDLCGRHQLPSTLFMYAVPPEFMRNVVPDYPALHQRLKSPTPMSVRSPQAVLIDLERLDLNPPELLTAVATKLVTVFEIARGVTLDAEVQQRNAKVLAKAAVDAFFEVNHRRLFVKAWVDLLFGQHTDGERCIDEGEARALIEAGHGATQVDDDDFVDF